MAELTLPSDYDKDDGWNDTKGCDQCPHCETIWSMNGGMQGPAYDSTGQRYKIYLDSDPADGPFFCQECWNELKTNRKRANNQTLGDFE